MMKNPQMAWAAVVVVFILVAGAVTLVALDKDVTVVVSLAALVALPVLSAFGVAVYQKLDQVKEISNGNQGELLKMVKSLHDTVTQLALQIPPEVTPSDNSSTVRIPDQPE